eukprot:4579258-Amphidinium_carterae.1
MGLGSKEERARLECTSGHSPMAFLGCVFLGFPHDALETVTSPIVMFPAKPCVSCGNSHLVSAATFGVNDMERTALYSISSLAKVLISFQPQSIPILANVSNVR